jgi:Domain of unknown function (DUF5615)
VKLLLNEMWSDRIARELRRRGYDVLAATELPNRYRGVPDDEVFRRAQEDGRTLVTDNVRDFVTILADYEARRATHHGVVFALRPRFDRSAPRVTGRMVRALTAYLDSPDAARLRGAHFLG